MRQTRGRFEQFLLFLDLTLFQKFGGSATKSESNKSGASEIALAVQTKVRAPI